MTNYQIVISVLAKHSKVIRIYIKIKELRPDLFQSLKGKGTTDLILRIPGFLNIQILKEVTIRILTKSQGQTQGLNVNQAKSNLTEMEFWNLIRNCYHTMSMRFEAKKKEPMMGFEPTT